MNMYNRAMKHKGFTIVELLVVIAVIGILASITIVSYISLKNDGMDSKIKSTVKTMGDAISLYQSKTNTLPVQGLPVNAGGADTLVPAYLKQGYRDGLTSKNSQTNKDWIIRWHTCGDGSGGFAVYASLNNPSAEDISNFEKIRTACGHSTALVPSSGTPASYNYAQVF